MKTFDNPEDFPELANLRTKKAQMKRAFTEIAAASNININQRED